MPWLVVEFSEEGTVREVPEQWKNLDQKTCAFPKNLSENELSKFIEKEKAPLSKWKNHKIRILSRKNYDSIEEARKRAQRAMKDTDIDTTDTNHPQDSDLEPDSEEETRNKPKKAKETYFDLFSVEPTCSQRNSEEETRSRQKKAAKRREVNSDLQVNNRSNSQRNVEETRSRPETNPDQGENESANSQRLNESVDSQRPPVATSNRKRVRKNSPTLKDCYDLIFDVSKAVAKISKNLDSIPNAGSMRLPGTEREKLILKQPTAEAVDELQNRLLDKEFRAKVKEELVRIGGVSAKDFIIRLLGNTLAPAAAAEFSLHGQKKKDIRRKALYGTQLFDLILEVVQDHYAESTKNLETVTSTWLRNTGNRFRTTQAHQEPDELEDDHQGSSSGVGDAHGSS